jgi:DNA sulfur modification protein DndE
VIDRLRLTANAKNQLISLKRKTGIEHNNTLCRHALCLSLANPTLPPAEDFNFGGGLEIDWRTFTGSNDELYLNLILVRLLSDGLSTDVETARQMMCRHVHRGLSYLASKAEQDLSSSLSLDLISNSN